MHIPDYNLLIPAHILFMDDGWCHENILDWKNSAGQN